MGRCRSVGIQAYRYVFLPWRCMLGHAGVLGGAGALRGAARCGRDEAFQRGQPLAMHARGCCIGGQHERALLAAPDGATSSKQQQGEARQLQRRAPPPAKGQNTQRSTDWYITSLGRLHKPRPHSIATTANSCHAEIGPLHRRPCIRHTVISGA